MSQPIVAMAATVEARRLRRLAFGMCVLAVLSGLTIWQGVQAAGGGGGKNKGKAGGALSVLTAQVRTQPVPLTLSALGQVLPLHSVAVRPQVTGLITEVGFKDGAIVEKGQMLFRIDPRPYQAAADAAAAALKKDQAALDYARWKAQHLAPQVRAGAVSAEDYEIARSDAAQAAAAAAADKADLEKAKLDLANTVIRAPLTARAGAAALKAGNLVEANATTPLVTLNQINPIEVAFSIPQNDLAAVQHYQQTGDPLEVQAQPLGGASLASSLAAAAIPVPSETGKLVFIDNAIAAASGTLALRGEFANDDHALWPGAYAQVQLVLTVQQNALVMPLSAIQQGQQTPFVYVVADGKAQLRNVTVTREQGTLAVIGAGVKAGETVVTQVPTNLRAGSAVTTGAAPTVGTAPASTGTTGSGKHGGAGKHGGGGKHKPATTGGGAPA